MNKGTVKCFHDQKGYGFLAMEDGTDVFVHYSRILSEKKRKTLEQGQGVEFDIVDVERGKQAVNVRVTEALAEVIVEGEEQELCQ